MSPRYKSETVACCWWKKFFLLCCACFVFSLSAFPASLKTETDPNKFLNTLAGHLLRMEFNLDINRIQVWPTNQYTAPVHRLVQLSANIFDCTSNSPASRPPYLPSVFRPLYTNDGGTIFISGFASVDNADILSNPRRSLENPDDRAALTTNDVVTGLPFVIAVRKGLPNFNQLVSETSLQASRKLEFRRYNSQYLPTETNQMYVFSLTNSVGVEFWNPYSEPFGRAVELKLSLDLETVMTNRLGVVVLSNQQSFQTNLLIPAGAWPPCTNVNSASGYLVPLIATTELLPPSAYSFAMSKFVTNTSTFERGIGFPIPDFWLVRRATINTSLVDIESNRLLDYVSIQSAKPPRLLPEVLEGYGLDSTYQCSRLYLLSGEPAAQWCTNRFIYGWDLSPTFGILNQIKVSQGMVSSPAWGPTNTSLAIDFFRFQFGLSPMSNSGVSVYRSNIFYAPYVPVRTIAFDNSLEANDPLVHYTKTALSYYRSNEIHFPGPYCTTNLGRPNPITPSFNSSMRGLGDFWEKDPDNWRFPTNQSLSLTWLGNVHRGTPWHTVYLKPRSSVLDDWFRWFSWQDTSAAAQMHPTSDWRLVDQLAPLFVDDYPASASSPNELSVEQWETLLGEISITVPGQTNTSAIDPNSPEAEFIATTLVTARSNQPYGRFLSLADLISIPQLSSSSPYLTNYWGEVPDQALESILLGLLPKLRPDALLYFHPYPNTLGGSGLEGHTYVIEASDNLHSWSSISTNKVVRGGFVVPSVPPPSQGARFYRSVLAD